MPNELPEPVVIERNLNAPVSLVWKALTDIEVLQKWLSFFPAIKPEVGFETRFALGPEGREYIHICQVTEVEHERKLTYSWRYEGYPGDAYVTFALEPQGETTQLTLTYRITELFPLDNPDFSPDSARMGWTYHADALKEVVEA